jgi:hypothetical protein
MSYTNNQSANAAINRANSLIDYDIHNDIHKQFEFVRQTLLADDLLTENEKNEAIIEMTKVYDNWKVILNEGTNRTCENCNQECLATLYCEHCIRNYLKAKFANWTSGNNNIDKLIQDCQIKSLKPNKIMEWIPYNNLINIEYLTRGGCSEIYTAEWIDGYFIEWDPKEQQLKRFGSQYVVLKRLENVENANQRWFEEVCN